MLAARYTQGADLQISEVAVPTITDGELLLRVRAASICGTDVKMVRHGHRRLAAGQTITLGHEFVGTVEQLGRGVEQFSEGMRVGVAPNIGCGACQMCARQLGNMCPDFTAFGITRDGGHAEYVRIPAAALQQGNVLPLPEGLSFESATLAEPLSCAVNGVRVAGVTVGDTVLVYGCGPMGLLNMMVAVAAGASRVVAVDLQPDRLQLAAAVAANDVINPSEVSASDWVKEHLERGVDVVILATPLPELQQEALQLLAPFGRLCLFAGWPAGAAALPLDTNPIHYKNLTVSGMTGGSAADYATALELIAEGRIDVSRIVSHVVDVHSLTEAYELALAGTGMKIVIAAGDQGSGSAPL